MADKQTVLSDASNKPPCVLREAGIPDELRLAPFVVWDWHWNEKRGKWDKVPLNPKTRRAGDATDPANQLSCDEAIALVRAGKADAIGVVLGELVTEQTLSGVDLDDCFDESGQLKSYAAKIVKYLDSYTEVSPSGTGLKTLLFGKLPPGAKHTNKEKGLEVYDGKRWFAITGNEWKGAL
jgi:putative DNA primase/helicase